MCLQYHLGSLPEQKPSLYFGTSRIIFSTFLTVQQSKISRSWVCDGTVDGRSRAKVETAQAVDLQHKFNAERWRSTLFCFFNEENMYGKLHVFITFNVPQYFFLNTWKCFNFLLQLHWTVFVTLSPISAHISMLHLILIPAYKTLAWKFNNNQDCLFHGK